MDYISSNTVLRHEHLPSSMNFNEFKATKDASGKTAFIIVNNVSGNVFDILDSRKSIDLFKYFLSVLFKGMINYHSDKRHCAYFIKEKNSSAFSCHKKHLL